MIVVQDRDRKGRAIKANHARTDRSPECVSRSSDRGVVVLLWSCDRRAFRPYIHGECCVAFYVPGIPPVNAMFDRSGLDVILVGLCPCESVSTCMRAAKPNPLTRETHKSRQPEPTE